MKINIDIKKFLDKFNEEYEFLYKNYDHVAGYSEALEWGDKFIQDTKNRDFVGEFIAYRGDYLTSDREVAAFAFALSTFE